MRSRGLLLLLLLVLFPLTGHADNARGIGLRTKAVAPPVGSGRQLAIVIGINDYQYWPPLEYAESDAELLHAFLRQRGFDVTFLANEQATRKGILQTLSTLKGQPIHRLLLFFAGHGHTASENGGERGYIIPVDGRRRDYDQSAIPIDLIKQLVQTLQARHTLLVFDSCYSGLALTRSGGLDEALKGYLSEADRMESIQVLTAGRKGDQAVEKDGHGLFTRYFVKAARGEADSDGDGVLTATEINTWVRHFVYEQSGRKQYPMYGRLYGEGEFLFVNNQQEVLQTAATVVGAWRTESLGLYHKIQQRKMPRKLELTRRDPLYERIVEIVSPNTSLDSRSFILNTINYGVEPASLRTAAPRPDGSRSKRADRQGEDYYRAWRSDKRPASLQAAIDAYLQAVALDPGNAHALSNLSLAYYRSQDYRHAIWAGLQSIDKTDDTGTIAASLYNIALCFQAEKKHEQALVFYLAALELRQRDSKTYRIVKERIERLFDLIGRGGTSL